jgi:hypothetical protein
MTFGCKGYEDCSGVGKSSERSFLLNSVWPNGLKRMGICVSCKKRAKEGSKNAAIHTNRGMDAVSTEAWSCFTDEGQYTIRVFRVHQKAPLELAWKLDNLQGFFLLF